MWHAGSAKGGSGRVNRRRLFTIASGLLLLLCVAAVALWSLMHRPDVAYFHGYGVQIMWRGREVAAPPYAIPLDEGKRFARLEWGRRWSLVTFPTTGKPARDAYIESLWVLFPRWFCVLSAILPLAVFYALRQWQSVPPNHCGICSYSLTGNTSGVCPECGTPVQQKGSAVAG
jgi:hypothetical protein